MEQLYSVSFHCYFPNTGMKCKHYQVMPLKDIQKWIDCYKFTHPNCTEISILFQVTFET